MKILQNELNIENTRGDTLSFGVEIEDLGQELDTAYFTCKQNPDDDTPLFQKSLDNGITLDHITDNKYYYVVRIAPDDTKGLEFGKYYYDLQIGVNEDIFTVAKGILTLEYDVTNEVV